MRLGLGTYACAWAIGIPGYSKPAAPMDAFAFLDRAAALGVRVVQYADNLPLDRLSDAERSALLEESRKRGIGVEVGTRGIAPDHLRTYLRIAEQFSSPILRVVIDTATHHPEPSEVVEILREVVHEFERAGVALAIENHDRFTARTLADMVRQLDSSCVGICLDTVNSFGALEGPQVVVETLAPYVVNLHVKDFAIRRADHNLGFVITGCPAGTGRLDLPWLLATLAAHGRECNAILELWPAPEAEMADTVAKETAWIDDSISNLRKYIKD